MIQLFIFNHRSQTASCSLGKKLAKTNALAFLPKAEFLCNLLPDFQQHKRAKLLVPKFLRNFGKLKMGPKAKLFGSFQKKAGRPQQ